MPLTLLMGGREVGYGRLDWEWGVLVNNVAVFSMWPLLKRDGLAVQYLALTGVWNWAVGYNPLAMRASFVKYLSLVCTQLCWSDELPQLTAPGRAAHLRPDLPSPRRRVARLATRSPPGPLSRPQPHPLSRCLRACVAVGDKAVDTRGLGAWRARDGFWWSGWGEGRAGAAGEEEWTVM